MARAIRQFACEKEGTPGTAIALDAGGADVLVKLKNGSAWEKELETQALDEVRSSDSHVADIVLRKLQYFDIMYNLIGPGDLTTVPAISDLIEAALFTGAAAKTIAISAVTGGPFQVGETITGDGSSATGIVLRDTANGESPLPYIPVSGVMLDTDTISGDRSSASADATASPADGGYAWRPAQWSSAGAHHLTCAGFYGGTAAKMLKARGCLADIAIEFTDGGLAIVTQRIGGPFVESIDQAEYTGFTFPESSIVKPLHRDNEMKFNTASPSHVGAINVSVPIELTPLTDTTSDAGDGIPYMEYEKGAPTISFRLAAVQDSTYNYDADHEAGTLRSFSFTHGAGGSAGTMWTIAAPAVRISALANEDIEPRIAGRAIELTCYSEYDANDEIFIWQH